MNQNLKKWILECGSTERKAVGNISYLFCDDEYLLGVNQQYLNHDTYTDIITFDYVAADLISGDIMISIDRVGENAEKFGVPFEQELHRVVIHGVLHLLGQGDKTDREAARCVVKKRKLWRCGTQCFPWNKCVNIMFYDI